MEIKRFLLLILIVTITYINGCAPFKVRDVHKQIKIGMTVNEVIEILQENKSRYHSYNIKLLSQKSKNECDAIEPEFDECTKTKDYFGCWEKFKNYLDDCKPKSRTVSEFIQITKDVSEQKISYSDYEVQIIVLFMGPAFLHNDFKIYFDSDAKVESKTKVRHWD
jgi:hypothetical protein